MIIEKDIPRIFTSYYGFPGGNPSYIGPYRVGIIRRRRRVEKTEPTSPSNFIRAYTVNPKVHLRRSIDILI